jgi:integrase/recombinase XerD
MENKILNDYKNYLLARRMSINYYNIMRIFLYYLEEQKIDHMKLSQEIITNFFNSHPEYSKNTLTQFIKAGRSFYSQFLQVPKEESHWNNIKYLKIPRRTPKFLTPEELGEIISKFCSYENRLMSPSKARVFINFMYMTGLRKNELLKLKRSDIDLGNGDKKSKCTIKLIGKGDKERFVYFSDKFSPGLRQQLIDYFNTEPEETNAFNLSWAKLTYLVKKMNKYLTERKITPHMFRHSFAKYLLDNGVPITYISKMLGHSKIETTMIYLNPTEEQIKNCF